MEGGLSKTEPATQQEQTICDAVKSAAEAKVNKQFPDFTAISFRKQIVNGTNYFVKVHVESGIKGYVHLRIYEKLPAYGGGVELTDMQMGKTKDDPIEYFD